VTVSIEDYHPVSLIYKGEESLNLPLQPMLTVELVDKETDGPIPKALIQVFSANAEPALLRTDAAGRLDLDDASGVLTLTIKAAGYQHIAIPVTQTARMRVDLEPFEARGIYVPFAVLSVPTWIEDILTMVEHSELNSVVVDVKSESGRIAWVSAVPLAKEVGAYQTGLMDLTEFLRRCRRRNVYAIARIPVVHDSLLAVTHPEWALKHQDDQYYQTLGAYWVDPFLQGIYEYNIALALEVAAMGFDEIQFDYLRFPSDGKISDLVYSQDNNLENRIATITSFWSQAYEALSPTPAFVSADIFGFNVWVDLPGDNNIGQRVEDIAPHVDYLSPMVYPSVFWKGNLGYATPALHPYEVIYRTLIRALERTQTKVRPWLQAYSLFGVNYGTVEMLKQKKASEDAQSCGWLFWNAGCKYDAEVFDPKAYERFPEALVSPPESNDTAD